jgi:hypothetical protein
MNKRLGNMSQFSGQMGENCMTFNVVPVSELKTVVSSVGAA